MNQQVFGLNYQDLTIPSPNFYALPLSSIQFAAYREGNFGNPNATFVQFWVDNITNPEPDVVAFFSQSATISPVQSLYT